MADRMTPEQVATLELPEGVKLGLETSGWRWNGPHSNYDPESYIAVAALSVANGHLPRSVYDWALRAYKGGDVPTVEQWEAAERLAALTRNDAHPDSIVAKLANLISPPEPPPLPEIEHCRYCGCYCIVDKVDPTQHDSDWFVYCSNISRCGARSQRQSTDRAAIEAHNEVAAKLRPAKEPRTCGGCKHFDQYPGLLCRTAHYTGGQARVLARPATPSRDASECERWEPKP